MVGPESFQPEASVKSLRSPSGRERSGRRRLRGGHRRSKSEGQKGKQELFSQDGAQRSSIRWTPAGWPRPYTQACLRTHVARCSRASGNPVRKSWIRG